MQEITSLNNARIKEIKKLRNRKYREAEQKYVIEGFHLVEEAINNNAIIHEVLLNTRGKAEWLKWLEHSFIEQVVFVSDEIMCALSDLPTPQGIMAIVEMEKNKSVKINQGSWLLLDQVQDPGNVGTMIRTADAAGLSGVIVGENTADIYSPKVLRSMQGSNFHLPIIQDNLIKMLTKMQKAQIPVYGTALNDNATCYTEISPMKNFGLIMGNEGNGVSKKLLEKTTENIYIPMKGSAESLNVAVAAGILLFHLEK